MSLVLTKPLGVGAIVADGPARGVSGDALLAARSTMRTLNAAAARQAARPAPTR